MTRPESIPTLDAIRGFKPTLLIGPILLVAAFVVWWVSDRLLTIGPFDRAQIGWGVVVPPWPPSRPGRPLWSDEIRP